MCRDGPEASVVKFKINDKLLNSVNYPVETCAEFGAPKIST